jgi:hypothetical protein
MRLFVLLGNGLPSSLFLVFFKFPKTPVHLNGQFSETVNIVFAMLVHIPKQIKLVIRIYCVAISLLTLSVSSSPSVALST